MSARTTFGIDELLAHADWLRRLARHLVGADADAEDALQETWTAALRSPPRTDRAPEPWLAEVLRNFVRRGRRKERSLAARAPRADAPAPVATPEALLERAQAQRLLAELVTALDEPFRSTVLLRYFEGQTAAEIARSQGVPAGTVRWRLKEGLDRLRAGLDARHRSDRRAWVLLLSPLVEPRAPRALAWKGALIVAMQKKTAAGLVLLVIALLMGVLYRRSSTRGPVAAAPPARASAPQRPPILLPPIALPAGEVTHDDSAAGSVEGRVVSTSDGAGIAGAELIFSSGEASFSARTDGQGGFRFAPGDPGAYLLARVSADGYLAFSTAWGDSPITFALRPGERIRGVRLALRPPRVCQGIVVDEAGRPVAGAQVVSYLPGRPSNAPSSTQTDAQGRFELAVEQMVEAHQGGRVAREQVAYAVFERCSLRLRLGGARLAAPVAISGRVESSDGRPVAGLVLEAWANPLLEPGAHDAFARANANEDGRFSLAPLEAIPYRVTATRGGREVARVADIRGGTVDLVLRVSGNGRVRGQVRDADTGAAIVSFSVVLFKAGEAFGPRLWTLFTRYDGQGAFEIEDVPAGAYTVSIVADGRTPSDALAATIEPEPAPPPVLDFRLHTGRRLFGQVIDRATHQPIAGARVAMEGRAGIAAMAPLSAEVVSGVDGRFELRGAPTGRLSLLVAATGHHGRVLGGLEMKADEDLGPLEVDLAATKEGEAPRIELIGIGAQLGPKGNAIVLGELASSGAAAKAGLIPGDLILAIDGQAVTDFSSFGDAVQRIRGAEGTVVVLRVKRADGTEGDLALTRARVRGP
jgi:RNA polymerase sigma factor (sigma-70 family)